ncbi:PREDICTED: hexamerin-like isoform X2 [Dinoponera quadriceps]|uniref:Hexamerin-like isoform X2 n=1 Tax=Dinoponera quadriceps TaxID=609295 RepID=A0A6P3X033_DINQU|nr:PREDICTED: hexamerin-like isoform X2 [Dinoponera quadriceps]
MKAVALILAAACLAHATQVPTHTATKQYLTKQKSIYELFWHIDQPTVYHPELYQKARSFSVEDNISSYNDQAIVTEFLQRWKHGMLPRGDVFSVIYRQHYDEMICLFRVLYTAKDFDTFYNTAVWARFHVNEHTFVYALINAVMHRPDTNDLRVPPLYEVLPNFFFNEDVLHKAYHVAMGDTSTASIKKTISGVDTYYIPANYSGWYVVRDETPEQQKLSYYIEDVGLNAYFYLSYHDFPWWMNSVEYHMPEHIRGESFIYNFKQMLTRYYLERLSNDIGEIDYVDVTRPIVTGYYPTMHSHNGVPFIQRPVNSKIPLHNHHYVEALQDFQNRIADAIDNGYLVDKHGKHINIYDTAEGLNHLCNAIQGNADSVKKEYYGSLEYMYRMILGFVPQSTTKYHIVPTSLHFICTSMRDPLFFGMAKNIVNYWMRYKANLPSYTHKELVFPGVKIESVTVDKLMTFFDHFDSLINNAVSVQSHEKAQSMLIKARQQRLNHKPFTYHITVNSDKNTKAVIRIFFAPKYDVHGHELDISENYMNFLEVDQWIVDLKSGINKIERHSHESIYVVPDEVPSEVLYKKIVKAIENDEPFTYPGQLYGFPERLVLPKGKKEGFPLKMFVCVTPFDETKSFKIDSPVWGPSVADGHPMGYPLDRPVNNFNFTVPNFYMKDVLVYHRLAEELNLTI